MSLFDRLALLLFGVLLFLPGMASRDLWNPDEPRYAEVAREMRMTGDYLVPHLNGRIYAEKPPLLFWLIAAASVATGGVDEISTRLPSLVAAVATLFLFFGIARRLFDRRIAWWATLILGTSGRILWQGRVGQIDMLLLALVTLAMYGFVRGWLDGRRGFYRLFFVAAGLATLAKGPVGLLPPLLSIMVFAWVSGDRQRLRELGIGTGLALWAAVVLLWLVPAALSGGGDYLQTLLIKQNITRFADPWHHFHPFYYYLTTIPADFFPWSLFLPGALWVAWRRSTNEDRRGFLFALCWAATTVLFFSLSPAKRTVYVLQMFPALALVTAYLFAEVERSGRRLRGWITTPCALLIALFALGPLALPRAFERYRELALLGADLIWWVGALFVVLAVAATWALVAAVEARSERLVSGLAAGMAIASLVLGLVLLPRFDLLKSARALSDVLLEQSRPEEPYAIYPRIDPSFLIYTRRFCELPSGEAELRAYAALPGRRWLLIKKNELARLEPSLSLREVARDEDEGEGYVLLASP